MKRVFIAIPLQLRNVSLCVTVNFSNFLDQVDIPEIVSFFEEKLLGGNFVSIMSY